MRTDPARLSLLALAATLLASPATAEDRPHWSFVPPRRPDVPKVVAPTRHPIDAFIAHSLAENGLEPAPEADRPTLLRRLTFDLTGLPPTPAELDAFLNDPSPAAYEALVERLLASPAYGERRAQHWLDLARYADTDGFEFDQARPNAYRYRDWVIAALNADMPYDRFVALQVAGDELAPDDPAAHVATGFHRCYPDMVDLNDQALRRQNALNDITETTGLVFMGLTLGCARCHDHKFDPISLPDFYRLQAFFTPAAFRDDYPVADPAQRRAFEREHRAWQARRAQIQNDLIALERPARDRLAPGLPAGLDERTVRVFEKDPDQRTSDETALAYEALQKDPRLPAPALLEALDEPAKAARKRLRDDLAALEKSRPSLPGARVLEETSPRAPPTRLLNRGDFSNPGEEVEPAFLPALLTADRPGPPPIRPLGTSTGRRTALAAWLTSPDHPLTARVMVNRLWQQHFGRGLVGTPSDLGAMGEEPTHPQLLDWLACEFIARGWSLKALHRLIVTSSTYRRSSRASAENLADDPDNTLLSHQNRRRLEGEAIRDALLAVAGRLNPAQYGPPVFPELPGELTKLSSKGDVWPVSPDPRDRDRRSLYVFVRRNLRYPFFEAFDRPDTNASCPQRPATTIAPQALSLLNSTLAHEAAAAFAERITTEAGANPDPDRLIETAFRLVYARSPDATEREAARTFLADGGPGALRLFALALLNANEFIYLD